MTFDDALMQVIDDWWEEQQVVLGVVPTPQVPEHIEIILRNLEAKGHGFDLDTGDWS